LTPRRTEELAPELVGADDKEGDEQEYRATAAALSDAEAAPAKVKEGDSSSSKENNAGNDNADEEDKSKRPFLILCLDGGGLKSVLEATILERYMHAVHDDDGIGPTNETHRIAFQPSDGVP
jgi:hypothetical protein